MAWQQAECGILTGHWVSDHGRVVATGARGWLRAGFRLYLLTHAKMFHSSYMNLLKINTYPYQTKIIQWYLVSKHFLDTIPEGWWGLVSCRHENGWPLFEVTELMTSSVVFKIKFKPYFFDHFSVWFYTFIIMTFYLHFKISIFLMVGTFLVTVARGLFSELIRVDVYGKILSKKTVSRGKSKF